MAELLTGTNQVDPSDKMYAYQWKQKLPDLSGEKNEILRREMLQNAHMMEASAKYSDYYHETFIPGNGVQLLFWR